MTNTHPAKNRRPSEAGSALVEFALLLPLFVLLLILMVNLSQLLDRQISITHLGREGASVLSRGADLQGTIDAIVNAGDHLDLGGAGGRVIVTRVTTDTNGNPIITAQRTVGGLARSSSVGTLPPGAPSSPATVPNGRTLSPGSSLVVVELFSLQDHFLGLLPIAPGQGTIVVHSRASF